MNNYDVDKLKEILYIDSKSRVSVRSVSNGFNIRIIKPPVKKQVGLSFTDKLKENKYPAQIYCARCTSTYKLEGHHIVPKSAGGKDDVVNGVLLCHECHSTLHNAVWKVSDVVGVDIVRALKLAYGVKH